MKKCLYLIICVCLFMFGSINVEASPGQLKKASIKTCNGNTYGQHGDGHWHLAENRDGRYYALGDPISSDPCTSSGNTNNNTSSSNNNTSTGNNNTSTGSNNTSSNNNPSTGNNNTSSNNNTSTNNNNTSSNNNTSTNNNKPSGNNTTTNNNNQNNTEPEVVKSNDNTLKAIIINGSNIEMVEKLEYSTKESSIDINVTTNDKNATFEIKNNKNLKIGNNIVTIEVKAENGDTKKYEVNVNRELVLSSDTGISVTINDEEAIFNNNKATVNVSSSTKNINIDYKLSDSKAKAEIGKIDNLKTGDNLLKISVIAEDGSTQEYEINIYKYSTTEEIISTIIVLGIFGGTGYGIYYLIKKRKNKRNK